MQEAVKITREVLGSILRHAREDPARECCGLLAGRGGMISILLPATNVLASATAFEIAPRELFILFHQMRAAGWEHLGIYHSHPAGENVPSRRDVEQAFYPDAVYCIASPAPGHPRPLRAFRIREGSVLELAIIS